MTATTNEEDRIKYANCMMAIKNRLIAIDHIFSKQCTTTYPITNMEMVCLQFRKIFELITYSCLCANRPEYEELRKAFKKDWRVADIIPKIRNLNPNFFPKPSTQVFSEDGTLVGIKDFEGDTLTETQLTEFHGRCGSYLHARNPYKTVIGDDELKQIMVDFDYWRSLVLNLLNSHKVHLTSEGAELWVLLNAGSDVMPNVTEMVKVEIG